MNMMKTAIFMAALTALFLIIGNLNWRTHWRIFALFLAIAMNMGAYCFRIN